MLNAIVKRMGAMLIGSNLDKLTYLGKGSASQKSVKSERTRLKTIVL